jgi:hypothetical protein
MAKRIILLLILAALAAVVSYVSYVKLHRSVDSKRTAAVRRIEELETRLKSLTSGSTRLSLEELGQVWYGSFAAPIWKISFTPEGPVTRRVLLTGGVHGNEPAGTEAVLRFAEARHLTPDAYPGTAFDLIPLVNPWGWVHDRRHTGDDRDINRDFASFRAQESRIIRDALKGKTYDLIVDHHEDSGATGFYLYQLANVETPLCRRVLEAERRIGYPIEQNRWMVILKTQDGLIDAPGWTLKLARLARQLSMTNYCRLTGNRRVFLQETPKRLPWEDRLTMHKTALAGLLDTLKN